MSKPKLIVYMEESILSSIKKEAFSEGKSTSEIAAKWLRAHYENPSRSEDVPVEAFKKAIREMRNGGEDEEDYRTVLADLGLESLKAPSGSPTGHGLSPEVIRYLVGTQARIDSLLRKVLIHTEMPRITPGEREAWIGVASRQEEEVLKNLNLGGENERQHG